MAICKPIFSNSATGLFDTTAIQNFIPSFDSPVNRYDNRQVTILNVLFNALLQALPDQNLNQYPNLKNRIDQGPISDEEFADFIFDQGILPDTIQDQFESDFPIPVNIDLIGEYVDDIGEAINQQFDAQGPFIDTGGETGGPDGTGNIGNDINIVTNPTLIPIDTFIPGVMSIDPEVWQPGPELQLTLQQAENYYAQNLAVALTENICGGFINPFAKLASFIAGAFALVDTLSGLKSKVDKLIASINDFSFGELIGSLLNRLNGLITKLIDLPEKIAKELLIKVNSLQETALKFINEVKVGAKRLFKFVNKKVQEIKEFLNDLSIENIKKKLNEMVKLNIDQFEDLLPAVINVLALKICGFTNGIKIILSRPVDEFKSFIDRLLLNYQIIETESIDHTNQAISGGAIRIPPTRRVEEQERAVIRHNSTTPGADSTITPGRYVTLEITEEERRWVNTITEDYSEEFKFSDSVKNMGSIATDIYLNGCPNRPADHAVHYDPQQNKPTSGWSMIVEKHPEIFIKLKRASIRLNSGTLTINSAFRSPYYNRIYLRKCRNRTGAAWNSLHMSAMALDISTAGLTNEKVAELIKYLSQEGFSRISVYPKSDDFIHIDIADQGTYRGDWTKEYRDNTDIRVAMQMHLRDEFRKGARAS